MDYIGTIQAHSLGGSLDACLG